MNYLAHLYLSSESPEALVGAMLGDFVKGSRKDSYPTAIRRGIELHRSIDTFTDVHEIVRNSKRLFSTERRRFAGILLDIFFDHFLAKNWSAYHELELKDFTNQAYQNLQMQSEWLTPDLAKVVPMMSREDWLGNYQRIDWVEFTLTKLANRVRRGEAISTGIIELQQNYEAFEKSFAEFFPALITFVQQEKLSRPLDEAGITR
jgi:acyl carrier protein phosphodiesterase